MNTLDYTISNVIYTAHIYNIIENRIKQNKMGLGYRNGGNFSTRKIRKHHQHKLTKKIKIHHSHHKNKTRKNKQ
jgi:hypothetical protein